MARMLDGFALHPGALDEDAQRALAAEVMAAAREAPFYAPVTPGGRPFSVRMTNLGDLGWVSDRSGYRYQARHPHTGRPWPPIPQVLLDLWRRLADPDVPPEACLVNLYGEGARMGLHRDEDEAALGQPVLSASLGDQAVFRIGPPEGGPTFTVKLSSGDVAVFGGPARLARHGIDRVLSGSSRVVPGGGRLNLTLRRVTPP